MAGAAAGGAASSLTAATDAGPVMAVCEQRCACVGEMKVAAKLMTGDSGALLPIDFQDAWCNEGHDFHKHATAAITQLYTYMQVLGVSYGEQFTCLIFIGLIDLQFCVLLIHPVNLFGPHLC
jgi:hypothetical protein